MSRARDRGFGPFPRPLTGAEAQGQSRAAANEVRLPQPQGGLAEALACKGRLDPTAAEAALP